MAGPLRRQSRNWARGSSIWAPTWGWPAGQPPFRTGAFECPPANAAPGRWAWLELEDGPVWTINRRRYGPAREVGHAPKCAAGPPDGCQGFAFGSAIGLDVATVRPPGISSRNSLCNLVRLALSPWRMVHVDPGWEITSPVAVDSPLPAQSRFPFVLQLNSKVRV